MKGRESGMPEEAYWESLFDAECILRKVAANLDRRGDLIEFGCGYGTFTLPAARRTTGVVTALDIEPGMVSRVRRKAAAHGLNNVRAMVRDFTVDGTGLPAESQAHAMMFNLLHIEDPVALLREACRVLCRSGELSVIHWRSDIATPRGPPPGIRPTPEQCAAWIKEAGFDVVARVDLTDCCPYHFGLVASFQQGTGT